jgi:hypothetical protein
MNDRAASRAVLKNATPKNCAASGGVFIIPRKRDKFLKPHFGVKSMFFWHPWINYWKIIPD